MILYLHGFASGPRSKKGVAVEEHFAARGVAVRRLDLRVPSFEHLRLSAMMEVVEEAMRGVEDVVLMGSSLGGLCAAKVAARHPRVRRVVLLAPAFELARRWRARDPEGAARWEREGWLTVTDHTTNLPARVDVGFLRDVETVGDGFTTVQAPTLVIHGRHDDTVGIETSRLFAAGSPMVRLVEVDDGHELVGSLPRILGEVERFLGKSEQALAGAGGERV